MSEQVTPETQVTVEEEEPKGTRPHDADLPEKFLAFMRSGWRDSSLEITPRDEAPNHAKRRAQLSAADPGEIFISPSGTEQVRANDTSFPFRPGSDFIWLTGEHDPDAVLIMRPNGSG